MPVTIMPKKLTNKQINWIKENSNQPTSYIASRISLPQASVEKILNSLNLLWDKSNDEDLLDAIPQFVDINLKSIVNLANRFNCPSWMVEKRINELGDGGFLPYNLPPKKLQLRKYLEVKR